MKISSWVLFSTTYSFQKPYTHKHPPSCLHPPLWKKEIAAEKWWEEILAKRWGWVKCSRTWECAHGFSLVEKSVQHITAHKSKKFFFILLIFFSAGFNLHSLSQYTDNCFQRWNLKWNQIALWEKVLWLHFHVRILKIWSQKAFLSKLSILMQKNPTH